MDAIPTNAQQLAPGSVTVARLHNAVIMLILLAVSAASLWRFAFEPVTWIAVISTLLLTPLLLWMPAARYQRTRYWLKTEGLYIQRGIWWRSRVLVPHNRIQHTDVTQGPLQRKYQLGTLIVHTAGTTNASVSLSGILHSRADELRDQLSRSGAKTSDAI